MKMLKMCLNWKVLAGLAAVGIGTYAIAPGTMAAALPILALAACPLSMLLMMKVMYGERDAGAVGLPREDQKARQAALDGKIDALERGEELASAKRTDTN